MAEKLCASLILLWILGQICVTTANKQICSQNLWCSDCITAHKDCAWCRHEDFTETRCSTHEDLVDLGCYDHNIVFPDNAVSIQKNVDFQDWSSTDDAVQFSPQHVKLKLRPGKKQLLDVKYRVAANLPIDMYFVIDFSLTMKDRIKDLAEQTEVLIHDLKKKFTTDINIGFGSFVDKPVEPYSITTPEFLANPCVFRGIECEPTYGYIHRRRLNNDIQGFIDTIKNSQISANYDPAEGGLDALLQAAVCPDIIGWRDNSRRVLVYVSDSTFHFAGDGKLAGIEKVHDGLCHMAPYKDRQGEFIYTHSKLLDYPSYGHLKKVLAENRINSFFLVHESDKTLYQRIANFIGRQAASDTMGTEGSEYIASRISPFFENLRHNVDITAEDLPEELEVIAETRCNNTKQMKRTDNLREQTITCDNLENGDEIDMTVSIMATECPKDKSKTKVFKLASAGLKEQLLIEVDFICNCECENLEHLVQDSEICSHGNGTLECGVCRCNPGRSGEFCQCDDTDTSSDPGNQDANCVKHR